MKSKTKRRVKRAAVSLTLLGALIAAMLIVVPYATRGASWDSPRESGSSNSTAELPETRNADSTLTVTTLNIAHGRGTGRHQFLLQSGAIRANLDEIAKVLSREQPDVVALQEADGPSLWSGDFNHVEYLAHTAGFSHRFLGEHVNGLKTCYGTALLSRTPLIGRCSVTFAPSPPTLSKGYVVSRVGWPGRPGVEVTVVSVHLDFSRASVRKTQVETMIRNLAARKRPLVVMGDFNCSWTSNEDTLRALATGLSVRPYRPTSAKLGTFRSSGARLDWILISDDLDFDRYELVTDAVSDHRGVIASLKLTGRK